MVALVLLADVHERHAPVVQHLLQVVQRQRLEALARLASGEVAGDAEEADRVQPARRELCLVLRARVQRDSLAAAQDEPGLGRERAARRNVDRAGDMAARELVLIANVQDGRSIRRGEARERRPGADEHSAVQLDDSLHVGRARCPARGGRLPDEVRELGMGERGIEAALEADRGRGLGAHPRAAKRARDVAWEELDSVRQLEQAPQAVEEALGALFGLDREIRPRGIADEQRVAGQDEPGLVRARTVDHGEGAVLRPVPRRMDDAQRHLSHLDLRSVLERLERVRGISLGMDSDWDALLQRQPPVAGEVVGVRVRLEDACQADALALGRFKVLLDGVGRIDHDGFPGLLVTD